MKHKEKPFVEGGSTSHCTFFWVGALLAALLCGIVLTTFLAVREKQGTHDHDYEHKHRHHNHETASPPPSADPSHSSFASTPMQTANVTDLNTNSVAVSEAVTDVTHSARSKRHATYQLLQSKVGSYTPDVRVSTNCGTTTTADYGHITSVGFPGHYPSTTCHWTIQSAFQTVIEIYFASLHLEFQTVNGQLQCIDTLDIYQSATPSGTPWQSLCTTPTAILQSSSSVLTFVLNKKSTTETLASGFALDYVTSDLFCEFFPPINPPNNNPCKNGGTCNDGNTFVECTCPSTFRGLLCDYPTAGNNCPAKQQLSATTGSIQSAGYPADYPNNANCQYQVAGSANTVVHLNFDAFVVEQTASGDCKDYLLLNNVKFCGYGVTPQYSVADGSDYVSDSNNLTVSFNSDANGNYPGFNANYTIAPNFCGQNPGTCDLTRSVCVNTIEAAACACLPGYTGPQCQDFVDYYCQLTPCQHGGTCTPLFEDYSCTCTYGWQGRNCTESYPTTTAPPTPTTPPHCGGSNLTNPCNPEGTDHCEPGVDTVKCICKPAYTGVTCDTELPVKCGGLYTQFPDILSSPSWKGDPFYPHDANCRWQLVAPSNMRILVKFDKFDVLNSTDCFFDNVALTDTDGRTLATLCGSYNDPNQIPIYSSNGNTMIVTFKSNFEQGSNEGFTARYFTDINPCAGKTCPVETKCVVLNSTASQCVSTNYCNGVTCQHGGTCRNDIDSFTCDCPPGWVGDYCEKEFDFCVFQPCENNGTCMTKLNGFECACADGFYGTTCENAPCTFTFNTANGVFASPGYPDPFGYPINANCSYTIVVPDKSSQVWLRFLSFNLEGPTIDCNQGGQFNPQSCKFDCSYDAVRVYASAQPGAMELDEYCGHFVERVFKSVDNSMRITFTSDDSVGGNGFLAVWNTTADGCASVNCPFYSTCSTPNGVPFCSCDAGYQEDDGSCTQIDECQYVTCANGGTCVSEVNAYHCNCDSGYTGQFCEEKIDYCSSGPCENGAMCTSGIDTFECDCPYNFYGSACESEINVRVFDSVQAARPQNFTSPNYPSNYPANAHYMWLFTGPRHSNITLNFLTFNVEGTVGLCFDTVTVFDGDLSEDINAPVLGTFCGTTIPPALTSQANTLTVMFNSDITNEETGFLATYTVQCSDGWGSADCGEPAFTDAYLCNTSSQVSTSGNGFLFTPNYPNPYPALQTCAYSIRTRPGDVIFVQTIAFDLAPPDNGECFLNGLTIYDTNFNVIGQYCGSEAPEPLSSSGGMITFLFRSDLNLDSNTGFKLQWATIQDECTNSDIDCGGGQCVSLPDGTAGCHCYRGFFGDHCNETIEHTYNVCPSDGSISHQHAWSDGTITSPNYPNAYTNNTLCLTTIVNHDPLNFFLTFTDFELEMSDDCTTDYVEVYDSQEPDPEKLLGRFCGTDLPPPLQTTEPYVSVLFSSDSNFEFRGFSLYFQARVDYCASLTCLGHSTCINGISGPVCQCLEGWTGRQCESDIDECEEIPTLCQNDGICQNLPGTFVCNCPSGYEGMFCETDFFCPSGFCEHGGLCVHQPEGGSCVCAEGIYGDHCELVRCGGYLDQPNGVIQSPLYPSDYPNDFQCIWHINPPGNDFIALKFDAFGLQPPVVDPFDPTESFCVDFLNVFLVRNGGSETLDLQLCGNMSVVPYEYVAASDSIILVMGSSPTITDAGFSLRYFTVPDHCVNVNCGSSSHCVNTWTNSTCACLPGYTGPNCETNIDDCVNANCKNGATCVDGIASYTCNCTPGWTGTDCGAEINYCEQEANPCQNGGICTQNAIGGYNCTCPPMYTGHDCELCGPIQLTDMISTFQSPNYPNNYPSNLTCTWILNPSETRDMKLVHGVLLDFLAFALEGPAPACNNDYLKIYNNTQVDDKYLVATLCGLGKIPENLFLNAVGAALVFHSDETVEYPGFSIDYTFEVDYCADFPCENDGTCVLQSGYRSCECAAGYTGFSCERKTTDSCGGVLNSTTGMLASPGYPEPYSANSLCTWVISAPTNNRIVLEFLQFDVEQSINGDCESSDYVEILDGHGRSLGLFCGNTLPPTIQSHTDKLVVTFNADMSLTADGFLAAYYVQQDTCIGHTCPANQHCIVQHDGTPACDCDFGYVAPTCTTQYCDGVNCGHGNCINQASGHTCNCTNGYSGSTCNVDVLCLIVDPCANGGTCSRDANDNIKCTCPPNFNGQFCENVTCGDSFVVTAANPSGNISSVMDPENPGYYLHGVDCVWTIKSADATQCIHAIFEYVDLSSSAECATDYIQLISDDHLPSNYTSYDKLCPHVHGSTPFKLDIPSRNNELTIHFHSDEFPTTSRQGFALTYMMDHNDCLNNPCPANSICLDMLGNNYTCLCVLGYQNVNGACQEINDCLQNPCKNGGTCSNLTPGFTCKCPAGYTGFDCSQTVDHCTPNPCMNDGICVNNATGFTCVCQDTEPLQISGPLCQNVECITQVFTQEEGIIFSPLYPNAYPPNIDCTWHIVAPYNRFVTLDFETFALQGANADGTCIDSVSVYDDWVADTNNTETYRQFCGILSPAPSVIVNEYNVTVKFHSDATIQANGFVLLYKIQRPSVCDKIECMNDGTCRPDASDDGFTCDCPYTVGTYCEVYSPNACNEVFTMPGNDTYSTAVGAFSTPGFPFVYDASAYCAYVIHRLPGEFIELRFYKFDLDVTNCAGAYLRVSGGTGPTDYDLLDTLCGNTLPATLTLPFNYLYLEFVTDASAIPQGFNGISVGWIVDQCNGYFCDEGEMCENTETGPRCVCRKGLGGQACTQDMCNSETNGDVGFLSSPRFPDYYVNNADCLYHINVDEGKVVMLIIDFMDIEGVMGVCDTDYLEFYHSLLPLESLKLAKYCGKNDGVVITSLNNYMTIKFHSDDSIVGHGFSAIYNAPLATCDAYVCQNNGTCQMFGNTPDCVCQSGYAGHFCEQNIGCPPGFCQNGGTCNHLNGSGSYCDCMPGYVGLQCEHVQCGGMFYVGDFIASPFFPANYPNNADCWYLIQGTEDTNQVGIIVDFIQFEAQDRNCEQDYIVFYDHWDTQMNEIGRFCNEDDTPIMIGSDDTSRVLMVFKSDESITDLGFSAVVLPFKSCDLINCGDNGFCVELNHTVVCECEQGYEGRLCEKESCGFTSTGRNAGVFHSQGYPTGYAQYSDCTYRIEVGDGLRIRLDFLDFDVGTDDDSSSDRVFVYDGWDDTDELIADLHGDSVPTNLLSSGNRISIKLKATSDDPTTSGSGFFATYTSLETFVPVTGLSGHIDSLDYVMGQFVDAPLIFEIGTNDNITNISLTFTQITINDFPPDCNTYSSAVQIYYVDKDDTTNYYGQFCGTLGEPITITVPGAYVTLFMRFSSQDPSDTPQQVVLDYTAYIDFCADMTCGADEHCVNLDTKGECQCLRGEEGANCRAPLLSCGGMLTPNSTSIFHSPRYPDMYVNGADCYWQISAPDAVIAVSLEIFGIQGDFGINGCTTDYIEVLDYDNTTVLGKYCGFNEAVTLTSKPGSDLFVHFHSDNNTVGAGFVGQALAVPGGCDNGNTICYNGGSCQLDIKRLRFDCKCPTGYTGFACEFDNICTPDLCQNFGACSHSSVPPCDCLPGLNPATNCATLLTHVENITSAPNNFSSAIFPFQYPQGTTQTWFINIPHQPVRLTFEEFNLPESENCTTDSLTIYADPLMMHMIGKYCGKGMPIISSPNGMLILVFTSTSPRGDNPFEFGFYVSVTAEETSCIDIICLNGGTCSPDQTFSWACTCPPHFDGYTCEVESVCASSPCQNFGTCVQQSSGYRCICTDEFTGDNCETLQCGGVLDGAWTGVITSPGFAGSYPDNAACVWTIVAPEDSVILFTIDDISVQCCDPFVDDCVADTLAFYDGEVLESTRIGQYCGVDAPPTLLTSGNKMSVVFTSDKSEESTGFEGVYSIVYLGNDTCSVYCLNGGTCDLDDVGLPSCSCPEGFEGDQCQTDLWCEPNPCLNGGTCRHGHHDYECTCDSGFFGHNCQIVRCGNEDVQDLADTLTSPFYPMNYPPLSDCKWLFKPELFGNVTLNFNFTTFDVESSTDCMSDYVQAVVCHDEFDCTPCEANPPKYCGSMNDFAVNCKLTDPTTYIMLEFVSDSTIATSGFSVDYIARVTTCPVNYCLNGGTVVHTTDDMCNCNCATGYGGIRCEIAYTKGWQDAALIVKQAMDETADPCNDFYQFSCGGWIKMHPLPAGAGQYDINSYVQDQVTNDTIAAIEAINPNDQTVAKSLLQTKIAYESCINSKQSQLEGNAPLLNLLNQYDGWLLLNGSDYIILNNHSLHVYELGSYIGLLQGHHAVSTLISVNVDVDWEDVSHYALYIDQGSLDLGSPLLYLNETNPIFNEIVQQYVQYMTTTATQLWTSKFGTAPSTSDAARIQDQVAEMLLLEKKVAAILVPDEQRRNYAQQYNKMTLMEAQQRWPYMNWTLLIMHVLPFNHVGNLNLVDQNMKLIVNEPGYLDNLGRLIQNLTDADRTLANYMVWRLVDSLSDFLDSTSLNEYRKLVQKRDFVSDLPPAHMDCMNDLIQFLPYTTGRLYTDVKFSPEARAEAAEMVTYVHEAFSHMLEELYWLDPVSKANALNKLRNIVRNVGYPDWIKDNAQLDQYHEGLVFNATASWFDNYNTLVQWSTEKGYNELNLPMVNRHDFLGSPATENDWYQPELNSITFPAAQLQPPFFQYDFPKAVNYGAMGATIGHETTHGFDDEGVQYDWFGKLNTWMDAKSQLGFKKMADCVVDEFNHFCYTHPPMCLDGETNQGENIADSGGMVEAYRAYRTYVERNGKELPLPGLEKYTMDQIFFISFGISWCGSNTPEYIQNLILTNPHSPERDRVIGTLRNYDMFGKAFNCVQGVDKMYPANNDKCFVWSNPPNVTSSI